MCIRVDSVCEVEIMLVRLPVKKKCPPLAESVARRGLMILPMIDNLPILAHFFDDWASCGSVSMLRRVPGRRRVGVPCQLVFASVR